MVTCSNGNFNLGITNIMYYLEISLKINNLTLQICMHKNYNKVFNKINFYFFINLSELNITKNNVLFLNDISLLPHPSFIQFFP